MKIILAAALAAAFALPALAQGQHYVQPHVDRNGNFVQGHMQTNPDGNVMNNWSTQGNVNPYTGQMGTVNPYQQQMPQPFAMPAPSFPQMQMQQQCGINAYGQYVCR